MKLTIGKLMLACGAVLALLVFMLAFIVAMPSPSDWGEMVSDAIGGGDMGQTSVQICAGFLNIGSCRSTQTQSSGYRAPSGGGSSSMPVLLIFASGFLALVFLVWIGMWLSGEWGQ